MVLEYLQFIHEKVSYLHLNILVLLGVCLVGAIFGGRFFEKIRVPQVIGYILIGVLLGSTGIGLIDEKVLTRLEALNNFALSIIAFTVGAALRKDVLQRYGKQFLTILFMEGFGAFAAISLLIFLILWLMTKDLVFSSVVGLMLGAIGTATDAASTMNVISETKARGPLTTTTIAIVALDDALAFIVFVLAAIIAGIISGNFDGLSINMLWNALYELVGAVVLGLGGGAFIVYVAKKYSERQRLLAFIIGVILLLIGISIAVGVDMLLCAMACGFYIANNMPQRHLEDIVGMVEGFAAPIYLMFFVLVGARLKILNINLPLLLIVAAYIIARTAGKMAGCHLGAVLSKAPAVVRKHLALCLFSQASAAIGLAVLVAQKFPNQYGDYIVNVVTMTTFFLQLIGPAIVKKELETAEETGRNITEEDVINGLSAKDIMEKPEIVINEATSLKKIWELFSASDQMFFPVVDKENNPVGVITFDSLKKTYGLLDYDSVILAEDIMKPVELAIKEGDSIKGLRQRIEATGYSCVVSDTGKLLGFIDWAKAKRLFARMYLERAKDSKEEE